MGNLNELQAYNLSILNNIEETSLLLENSFEIKFLTYRRFTDDGKLLHISRSHQWLDCSLEHNFLTSSSSISRIMSAKNGKLTPYLWPSHSKDNTYQALNENGFHNGITVYEKFNNQIELWAFYTEKEKTDAPQLYMNNFDIIGHFIAYFKDKHFDIINNKQEQLLIQTDIGKYLSPVVQDTRKATFLESTQLKKIIIKDSLGNNTPISMKEAKCLYELSRGKSIKEIGKELVISPRTVEFHVNKVKVKLHCANTHQLITLANQNALEEYLSC